MGHRDCRCVDLATGRDLWERTVGITYGKGQHVSLKSSQAVMTHGDGETVLWEEREQMMFQLDTHALYLHRRMESGTIISMVENTDHVRVFVVGGNDTVYRMRTVFDPRPTCQPCTRGPY